MFRLEMLYARASLEFYVNRLGFEKDWEHQFDPDFPVYASVSRDGLTVHLNEHGEEGTPGTLVVSVRDVDAAHAELTKRGLKPETPPEDRPYGVRDFAFTDPDGHRYVVATPLPDFDEAPGRTNAEDD